MDSSERHRQATTRRGPGAGICTSMKIQYYEQYMRPFIKLAQDDGDAICAVFFSREEDSFKGAFTGMDTHDALMVIKELADHFEIENDAIIEVLDGHQEQ